MSYISHVASLYGPAENFYCDNTVSEILENLSPVIKTKLLLFTQFLNGLKWDLKLKRHGDHILGISLLLGILKFNLL